MIIHDDKSISHRRRVRYFDPGGGVSAQMGFVASGLVAFEV